MRVVTAVVLCLLALVAALAALQLAHDGPREDLHTTEPAARPASERSGAPLEPVEQSEGDSSRTNDGAPVPHAARLPLAAPQTTPPGPAADPGASPPGGGLWGLVLDVGGAPQEEGQVVAFDRLGRRHSGEVAGGHYAIDELAPGRYWVRAWVRGHPIERAARVREERSRLDLVLPFARGLDVQVVTSAGFAVPWAQPYLSSLAVVVTRFPPGNHLLGEPIARVPARERNLTSPWAKLALDETGLLHASLVLNDRVLTAAPVAQDQTGVTLVLDLDEAHGLVSRLRLQVVDADDGDPVYRAACWLSEVGNYADAQGRLDLLDCPPGPHSLRIRHSDFTPLDLELELAPGETTDLGRIELVRGPVLLGEIVGVVPGDRVRVTARRVDVDAHGDARPPLFVDTHGNPRFRLNLPAGLYAVSASRGLGPRHGGLSRNHLVDLRRGPLEPIVLALLPRSRVVLQPDSSDWVGARCHIFDDRDLPITDLVLHSAAPASLMLPEGRYSLLVVRDGVPALQRNFRVAGEVTEVPFR